MQCLSCVFDNEECTHRNAEEEWQELAESGECPGCAGVLDKDNTYVLPLDYEK